MSATASRIRGAGGLSKGTEYQRAQDHAATRELIDIHRRRRREQGCAHERIRDRGSDLHSLGGRRDGGQTHEAVVVVKLGGPYGVEAASFRVARRRDLVLDGWCDEDQSVTHPALLLAPRGVH
jgi:hypothetical protein